MSGDNNHAALMDDVYRYQRYIYDFTRKYYLFGRDRLIRELKPKPGARIIEIGCGTARNLIKMAQTYPDARLYGLDASAEMLRTAEMAIERIPRATPRTAFVQVSAVAYYAVAIPFECVVSPLALSTSTLAADASC